MKKIIFIFILFSPLISAFCNETQIDINNAPLGDLDKIYGIGQVKAQEIIDLRPFEKLEDLLNVSGIAKLTFNKIIEQGLACVSRNEKESSPHEEAISEKIPPEKKEEITKKEKITNFSFISEPITQEIINLNPKTIKTKNSKETVEEKSYAKYLIIIFCILLLSLYTIKPRKKKNEWQ